MKKKQILQKFFILGFLFLVCSPASAAVIEDAYKDYLCGEYDAALSRVRSLPETAQGLYFQGITYIKIGDYPQAREAFRKVLKVSGGAVFYEPALIKFADTYFLEENFSKAKEIYRDLETKTAVRNYLPRVYLRLAQIAVKQGEWEEKNKYLGLIKKKYSRSPEMKFVGILLAYGDVFYIQVGAFSGENNAVTLKEELKSKHPNVYIEEERQGKYTLYKVRIGTYKQRNKAQEECALLIKKGYPARIYP